MNESPSADRPALPRRRLGRTGFEVPALGIGGWLGVLDDRAATAAQREAAPCV